MSLTEDLDQVWTDDPELKGLTSHYKSTPSFLSLHLFFLKLLCAYLSAVKDTLVLLNIYY